MAAVCGIDWAADHHDLRIADEHSGALLAERRFAHDEAGIGAVIELLIGHRVARVAIERVTVQSLAQMSAGNGSQRVWAVISSRR